VGLLAPNSGFAVLRRDPRCCLIYSHYAGPGQGSTYEIERTGAGNQLSQGGAGYLVGTVANFIAGAKTHGDWLVPWIFDDGVPRFWFQNEAASPSVVVVVANPLSTSMTLNISFFFGGVFTSINITATSDGSGSTNFTLPATNLVGYAAFRIGTAAAPTTYLTAQSVTMQDFSQYKVSHLALPQFWTNLADIDSIRINAASLMLSDRTAENYSQGDAIAYQASGGDCWEKMLGNTGPTSTSMDPYTTVTAFQDMYEGKYKKGRYIPLKPTDDPREMQLLGLTDAALPDEIAPIDFTNQKNFLYVAFNVGVLGSGVPSPTGKFTAYFGIEGESESQWRETRVPECHPDVMKEAKWCFAQVKCDFENPLHLKAIWDWVKKNAPHVLDAVDMISPILPPQIRAPVMAASGAGRAALAYFS